MIRATLCALLVFSVLSIDVQNSIWTNRDQQTLAQIKDSKWAKFILSYAEVHLQTQGVLNELIDGINQLIEELNEELNTLHANFQRRTNNHNRDVTQLEQEIQDADRDIFNANDMIDNVLIPTRQRYINQLNQLKENIAQNRKSLDEETLNRKQQRQEYESKVAEHNEAIDAIDQSLVLLSQITNPALVQVKRIQQNLHRVETSLAKHSFFAPLVRALVQIATEQNFSDQGALQQIVKAFGDLRNQLVASLNDITAEEDEQQKDFEERVDQLNSEFSDFQRQVLLKNSELTAVEEKLQKYKEYLTARNGDRATLAAQLQAENDDYASETEIYNNLVDQYTKELDASNKALALVTQPKFVEYVNASLRGQ